MQRPLLDEIADLPSPSLQLSRTQSRTSERDRTPSVSLNTLPAPPHIRPEPAYIAAPAAAHVVSSGLANRGAAFTTGEDIDEGTSAVIAPQALNLLNTFLDQLLYSFLASARSTSILSLKPAIQEILKPRLAKEAIDGADEELRGYMAGGDNEELLDFHNGYELRGGSNLHHIFKRTRLRCMVYTRWGDLEEDDEEAYLEAESPNPSRQNRLSRDFGNVSPAAAIFLTSIIEFIAEQALMIAGENAANRSGAKSRIEGDRLLVEAFDVEKIAFNKTLGRLWRSWKKAARTTSMISSRPLMQALGSPRKTVSEGASRATSISEAGEQNHLVERLARRDCKHDSDVIAGREVPPKLGNLPDEPYFCSGSDGTLERTSLADRPKSMINFKFSNERDPIVFARQSEGADRDIGPPRSTIEGASKHRRASSLPAVKKTTPYSSTVEQSFTTPPEEPKSNLRDIEQRSQLEKGAINASVSESSDGAPLSVKHGQGISTMYDGVLKEHPKLIPIEPSMPSREVSMSDYSDQPSYVNDPQMTPQALSFRKPSDMTDLDTANDRSCPKTATRGYSFHAGKQSPRTSSEIDKAAESNDDVESGVFLRREASIEQARVRLISKGEPDKLATFRGDPLKGYNDSEKDIKREIPVLMEAAANDEIVYTSNQSPQPGATINNSSDITYGDPAAFEAVQTRSEASTAKRIDLRKQPTSAPTAGLKNERAAVQRVQPSSPVTTRDSPTYHERASSGVNRDMRPVTAGSSASQVSSKIKGLMSRDSRDAVRQAGVARGTSSDVTREVTGGSTCSGKSSDMDLDFDQLIRSDETIQYTLTPQNMRDKDGIDPPRDSDMPPPSNSTSDTVPEKPITSPRSIKALRGMNGLRANPTSQDLNVMEFASPTSTSPTHARSQASPSAKPKSPQKRGPIAREPFGHDDSVRDFADFISSTGPDSDPQTPAKHSSDGPEIAPVTSGSSHASSTRPPSRTITKQQPTVTPKKSESNLPAKGNSKLTARDPIGPAGNTTADLADFLRSGPPGSTQVTQRSVSMPRRNEATRNGVGSGASVASTQDSYAASKMTPSSSNSRTALIDNTNRAAARPGNQRPQEAGGPVRKQRRVKDPYTIDSDEEGVVTPLECEPTHTTLTTTEQEETLSDFLANYNPPGTSHGPTRPIRQGAPSLKDISTPPQRTPTAQSKSTNATSAPAKRKGSGFSLRERVARNIAVIPDYRPLPPKAPNPKKTSTPRTSPPSSNEYRQRDYSSKPSPPLPSQQRQMTAPQLPPMGRMTSNSTASGNNQLFASSTRPQCPHLTHNGSKADSYRPSQPTYFAGRAQGDARPKLQARGESTAGRGDLSDLAHFLKETEPPTPAGLVGMGTGRSQPVGGKAGKMMGGPPVSGGGPQQNGPGSGSGGKGGGGPGRWRVFGKKR